MQGIPRPSRRPSPEPPSPAGTEAMDLCPHDPSTAELGRRIKMLRVARGLTLKDLESRGGISATHISEIERGRASPTVGALGRIARALGMSPATLVEPHVLPEMSLTRATERTACLVHLGTATVEPLAGPVQGAILGAHLLVLAAGRESVFSHRHDGEEWATVLVGVVEAHVDGESHLLHEGDSIHFRGHRRHSYANLSATPATVLVAGRPRPSF